jgi:hypothetical protein
MMLTFKLSPEIEGKFEVVHTNCPVMHSRIGYVDFRRITLAQAEELVKAGSEFLVPVGAKVGEIEDITPLRVRKMKSLV